MPLAEGSIVRDRYRIEGVLGRGGMGIVYAARQLGLDRAVALKVLASNDAEYIDRFRREVRILASLSHPNVLQVLDGFAGDDTTPAYLVTERLFGRTLNEVVRDHGPMTEGRVAEVGLQLADALSAAHAKGVIHRDVKPGNVFLTETTLGRDAIKLLDFGVARDLHATDDLTRDGAVVGTLAWLSPEQVEGNPADVLADVYAVGATLFFCLFGRKPFPQASIGETARAIVQGKRDSARELRPNSPVGAVIDRAMAVARSERYASTAELAAALRACAASGSAPSLDASVTRADSPVRAGTAPPPPIEPPPREPPPREPPPSPEPARARSAALPIAVVVAALVLGGAAIATAEVMRGHGDPPAPTTAAPAAAASASSIVPTIATTSPSSVVAVVAPAPSPSAPPSGVPPPPSPRPPGVMRASPSASTVSRPPDAGPVGPLHATVILGSLDGSCPDGSDWTVPLRNRLAAEPTRGRIDACAQATPSFLVKDRLELALEFAQDGHLTGIQQSNSGYFTNALTTCVEAAIRATVPPICADDSRREVSIRFAR
jgi:serine/threonine-protein kinase